MDHKPFPRSTFAIDRFTDERLLHLLEGTEPGALPYALVDLHEQLQETEPAAAQQVRRAFLFVLRDMDSIVVDERLARFLAQHIELEDYVELSWETPEQVVTYCEMLYGFRFESDATAERVIAHVNHLVLQALHAFEQQGEPDKMFKLLQVAPIPPTVREPELQRLRNRAYLYETRRVQRHRRILYAYLVVQLVLVLLVFPYLFIQAENCNIQDTVEETADVDLPEEVCRDNITYPDALYWSLITAGSIGYGDLTPYTRVGKAIAATLGVMGVITIGIIAGLILNWITPRRLD